MFADKFNTYFPAGLPVPSVTPLKWQLDLQSWLHVFYGGKNSFKLYLKKKKKKGCERAEVATLLLMPDCYCMSWSVQTPLILYIILLLYFIFVIKSPVQQCWKYRERRLNGQKDSKSRISPFIIQKHQCRCFCDNPFSFSFLHFYPGGREI